MVLSENIRRLAGLSPRYLNVSEAVLEEQYNKVAVHANDASLKAAEHSKALEKTGGDETAHKLAANAHHYAHGLHMDAADLADQKGDPVMARYHVHQAANHKRAAETHMAHFASAVDQSNRPPAGGVSRAVTAPSGVASQTAKTAMARPRRG